MDGSMTLPAIEQGSTEYESPLLAALARGDRAGMFWLIKEQEWRSQQRRRDAHTFHLLGHRHYKSMDHAGFASYARHVIRDSSSLAEVNSRLLYVGYDLPYKLEILYPSKELADEIRERFPDFASLTFKDGALISGVMRSPANEAILL